jgi:hypothetical protein
MSALLGLVERNGSREMLYGYWGIVGSFQLKPPSWTDLLPRGTFHEGGLSAEAD